MSSIVARLIALCYSTERQLDPPPIPLPHHSRLLLPRPRMQRIAKRPDRFPSQRPQELEPVLLHQAAEGCDVVPESMRPSEESVVREKWKRPMVLSSLNVES